MKRLRSETPGDVGQRRRSARLRTSVINTSRPTLLCNYCKSLNVSESRRDENRYDDIIYARELKDTLAAATTDSTCELCSFLTRLLRFPDDYIERKGDSMLSLRCNLNAESYGRTTAAQRPTLVELRLEGLSEPILKYDICKVISSPADRNLSIFEGKYPEAHPEVHDGHMRYVPRIVNSDPLSSATIGLIKDWLGRCQRHEFCKAQKPRPMPTRVIDLESEKPKIIESERASGHYIALSHCWGSSEDTFSTTADNIEERMTIGLDLYTQPSNFRDAIAFTKRLGFRYLWIDSLCIIQHDVLDWRHEASRMAGYYNNALLTLAIADAINCHAGFAHRRHSMYSPPIPGNGELYCLREELPQEFHLNMSSFISKRAWTFQERLLSPRIIHFTKDQLLWRCRADEWAEGYIYNSYRRHNEFRSDRAGNFIDRAEYDAYWRNRSDNKTGQVHFDTNFAAQTWYDCVSEFSTRSLTRASDKLAAIAGLADMFSQPELGKYMAGLWGRDLFRGLAWLRTEPALRTAEKYRSYIASKAKVTLAARAYKPPSEYRAPSWSWASVIGPIEIDSDMFYSAKRGASPAMQYEVDHWTGEYGPKLISSHLLHNSNNPYVDTLEGSYIRVYGYHRQLWISNVSVSSEDGPNGTFIKNIFFDEDMAGQPRKIYASLNEPDHPDASTKEMLMFQICKQCAGDRLVYCLLLECVGDADSFKRVGLLELACYNLCEIPEKQRGGGFVYYMHPMHAGYSSAGIKKKDYETKEWQKNRWDKGTLKLF